MSHSTDGRRLRVFLSFAGSDRLLALRLRRDLERKHIDSFVDMQNIAQAENTVLAINRALTQSDYYVLLWSQGTVDRPWVDVEWSAAFAHEINARRAFLFVVRLDRTSLPPLLAPRRYLNAFDNNWECAVDELVTAWRREWVMRSEGTHVLPAPCWSAPEGDVDQPPTILLYIRNRVLSVAHVLAVSEDVKGADLDGRVRMALALQESITHPRWDVGLYFHYRLRHADKPIPGATTLAELGIADGATIELEVEIEQFNPTGSSSSATYRRDSKTGKEPPRELSPAMRRSLINAAFGHLMP